MSALSSLKFPLCVGRHALVLEDDPEMAETLRNLLLELGFTEIKIVDTSQAAVASAHRARFDVILLDRLINGSDGGVNALTRIRQAGACRTVPVLMISSLGNSRHRTEGLLAGANDYVPKPVELDELGARINAQIWMAANHYVVDRPLRVGPLEVAVAPESLRFAGEVIKIPSKPLRVIYELARTPGQAVSFAMLWDRVWYQALAGHDADLEGQKGLIERTVRKARGFLMEHEVRMWGHDRPMITSAWGVGYMIAEPIHQALVQ